MNNKIKIYSIISYTISAFVLIYEIFSRKLVGKDDNLTDFKFYLFTFLILNLVVLELIKKYYGRKQK